MLRPSWTARSFIPTKELARRMGNRHRSDENNARLTLKDYLSLAIAALQTVLLPLVILIIVLIVLTLILARKF